jgi:tetratricopeptide (TPR) repeat protein
MKRNTWFLIGIMLFVLISCEEKQEAILIKTTTKYSVIEKDSIIDEVFKVVAKTRLNSQKRRDVLDSAITKYPSIAFFYQQRAMPLYKQDKDELGLPFLEKAAELNPEKYLDYMAFMKCIFSKNYKASIVDFEKYLNLYGEGYVMDHTYYFYIGISYLQLNEFEKAKSYLEKSILQTETESGRDWVHYLDLMYLGIAKMELKQYEEAILDFDESLLQYENFSDVMFYKAICLFSLGKNEEAKKLVEEAKKELLNGNTINEDNVIYERYPYQIRKSWLGLN